MLIFTIVLLSLIIVALATYFIYYKRQITNIAEQLEFIIENQSFKRIQTQIHPAEISRLVALCNKSLDSHRELERNFASRNAIINQTIVSLSHDIRTPLTSLGGYLQLAKDSSDQHKYIQMAESRITQINTLVDELFLYAKLQNPDYELDMRTIDITNYVQKQLFKYIEQFNAHHREPIINFDTEQIKISANDHAMERILENLINNYFIHGTGNLSVTSEVSKEHIKFNFSNQMSNTHHIDIDNIFTQFYKEDQARAEQSSGLGLSIVRALMHKMGGIVSAQADNDHFTIELSFPKL